MRYLPTRSFEAFSDEVRAHAESSLRSLMPSEDPQPQLIAWHPQAGTLVTRLPAYWVTTAAGRRAFPHVLVRTVLGGAERIGVTSSTWRVMSDTPAGREVLRRRAAGRPIGSFDELGLDGVVEEVIAFVADCDSSHLWRATITRTVVAPPQISTWRFDSHGIGGSWMEALRPAWEKVRNEA